MKRPKGPPWAIGALFCVIASLFISVSAAKPEEVPQLTQAGEAIPQFTLTMSKTGSGQGKVSRNPAGNVFRKGTRVMLRPFRRHLCFRRLERGVLGNVHRVRHSVDVRQDGDGNFHTRKPIRYACPHPSMA